MQKLSAYIVTLNEEARLEATLEAVSKVADEVIVVDSGSTDQTESIAKKYGAKFMFNKWETYCKQKSFAEQQCTNDLVLLIDADEVLSAKLITEINKIKQQDTTSDAYKIKIFDMYLNNKKPPLFAKSYNVVRLYNKQTVYMPSDCGNKDRVNTSNTQKISSLSAPIHHFCFLSIYDALAKYNLHSTEMQKTLIAENRKFSKLRLSTEFPRQFLHYYFKKKMCFSGVQGFTYAMVLAYFRFLKVAKWFENKAMENKDSKNKTK